MSRRGRAVTRTRRFLVLVAATAAASAVAALLGLTAVALALAAYVLAYLAAGRYYLERLGGALECRVDGVETVLREDDALLHVQLSLAPGAEPASLRMYVEVPPQLSRTGTRATLASRLEPRAGRARAEVRLPRRTGLHVLGPLTVVSTDPLGAFEVPVCGLDAVVVRVPPRAGPAPLARWYGIVRSSSGSRTLSPGTGVEYHSTREYRPEDELRHIDWKATARLGRLHVKVFEVETPMRVLAILDARSYMFVGGPRSLFEYAADLVAALAGYLLKRGDRLVVSVITEDGVRSSGELGGQEGIVGVLGLLSNIEWPARAPTLRAVPPLRDEDLRALGGSLGGFSAVIAVSPVLDERRALELLRLAERARESGARFMVVAPLVTFFSAASRVDDAVYRILRFNMVSRELRNVELLEKHGVRVITLSPHKALERVVADLERIRAVKAR